MHLANHWIFNLETITFVEIVLSVNDNKRCPRWGAPGLGELSTGGGFDPFQRDAATRKSLVSQPMDIFSFDSGVSNCLCSAGPWFGSHNLRADEISYRLFSTYHTYASLHSLMYPYFISHSLRRLLLPTDGFTSGHFVFCFQAFLRLLTSGISCLQSVVSWLWGA